ncbi:MAG: APC family permease [Nocardiopsaceae bacterium]|jgi:amino acid transporter|nr:APC family permease [Nocardiopsaceae bacterium]
MAASAADTGARQSEEGLRTGVLKVRHAVIPSLAVITPAAAILFLPIPIAANAGAAMPLSIIVAFVVVFVIMNAVYRFSQRISHAGSFFAFVRDSLGVRAGFFTGWLFMAFYPVFVAFDLILFGATLNGIIVAHGGPDIPWWLLMLVGMVLIWGVAVLGIRLSVRSDLALLTFEIAVLLALAITILAKGAPGGDWHAHVFSPSASPTGFSGVVVGAVFGVLAFTGFEAPAYLGEEAVNPRRTVPRAILLTTAGIGIAFVFFFYVTTVGYGLTNIAKLPGDPAPWDTLGQHYWGSGATILIDIASVVALVAGALACQNGAARMVYALGRDGLLPRTLGRTLPRFGTPAAALTLLLGFCLALGFGFGFGFQPLPAFTLLSLVVTLCALGVYAIAQVALVRYFMRLGSFNPFWHGLVPVLAVAAIVYLFIKNISPQPPYPSNLAIWISIGWAVLGLLVVFGVSVTRPARLAEAAAIIGDAEAP